MANEERYIYRHLDAVGDGSGSIDQNGDFSSTPQFFRVNAPAQGFYGIQRIMVQIRSSGMMKGDTYGDQPELTNGIAAAIYDKDDNIEVDLTDGQPIRNNGDWARYSYDGSMMDFGAGAPSSDQFLRVRWTFGEGGQPLFISKGSSLRFLLNDDFTGLSGHLAQVQGFFCISARRTEPPIFRVN